MVEVELNRPKALHALNLEMINAIKEGLLFLEGEEVCSFITLISNNEATKNKAFCAGGDVVALVTEEKSFREKAEFFRQEYALNHLIGTFHKPIVAILDGIVMGGGAGISVHAPFRIATENSIFAMPETAIGFFPDVGGSFFLPKLEGSLGMYLALTGSRLTGYDLYQAGIATHFVPSKRIPDLLQTLGNLNKESSSHLNLILNTFIGDTEDFTLKNDIPTINYCFQGKNIDDIFKRLGSSQSHFAKQALGQMEAMSPTSLAATFELMQRGRDMSLKSCLRMEYNLAKNMLEKVPDLKEGVTAKLIRKQKMAKWNPSNISGVDLNVIKSLFKSNEAIPDDDVDFVPDHDDYFDYPHIDNALPSTERIRTMFPAYAHLSDWRAVADAMLRDCGRKQGMEERLLDILPKHVRIGSGGDALRGVNRLVWVKDSQLQPRPSHGLGRGDAHTP